MANAIFWFNDKEIKSEWVSTQPQATGNTGARPPTPPQGLPTAVHSVPPATSSPMGGAHTAPTQPWLCGATLSRPGRDTLLRHPEVAAGCRARPLPADGCGTAPPRNLELLGQSRLGSRGDGVKWGSCESDDDPAVTCKPGASTATCPWRLCPSLPFRGARGGAGPAEG